MDKILSKADLQELTKAGKTHKNISEGFRPGKSKKVVDLLASMLAKRIDFRVVTSVVDKFQNKYGKFIGYYAASGDTVYRLNFLIADAESLHSIDVFNDDITQKENTFMFAEDINAVEMANQVAIIVTGSPLTKRESADPRLKRVLTERKNLLPYFEQWFNESEERLELLREGTIPELMEEIKRHWFEGMRIPNDQTIKNKIRAVAQMFSIQNENLSVRAYHKADKEDVIEAEAGEKIVDTEEITGYDEDIVDEVQVAQDSLLSDLNMAEIEGFEQSFIALDHWTERWEDYTDRWEYLLSSRWKNKDAYTSPIRGMIVYGSGGTGKSFYAKDMQKKYSKRIGYVPGAELTSSKAAIFEQYFKHRDKDIIVFDDASVVVGKSTVDKLKTFWQPPNEGGSYVTPQSNKQKAQFAKAGVPDGFEWPGATVVITNLSEAKIGDQASRDRFYMVPLIFSPEETIDKIATEYDNPEVSMNDRKVAATFLIRLLHTENVKPADMAASFRMFEMILMTRALHPDKWPKKCKRQILREAVQRKSR